MNEETTNIILCDDCGVEYCAHCGHNGCPGGRWVYTSATTSAVPVFMNGKTYKEHLEREKIRYHHSS